MIALAWPIVVFVLGILALNLVARGMNRAQQRDELQRQIDALREDLRASFKATAATLETQQQRLGEFELAVRHHR